MTKKNIDKELNKLIKEITKTYGEGSIMKFDEESNANFDSISTGSLILDDALGIGGYPKGRIIEIYGPESSGKTTLALHAIKEAQKSGGVTAYIDAEHALDPNYLKRLGIDLSNLIISQPDSGEQAFEILEHLIYSNQVDLVVIDSVAALVPTIELEGQISDQTIGAQARLMSKSLRKLTGSINKTDTTVIFINQIREKVGVIYGNPEITPGGRALKFYSSIRLELRLKERLKENNEMIGQLTKVKVVKNKMASPYKIVEIEINYKSGISKENELLSICVDKNIIERQGSWFSYNGEKLGQGKQKSIQFLNENPDLKKELKEKLNNINN